MRTLLLLAVLLVTLSIDLRGQGTKFTISVVDSVTNEAVPYATIRFPKLSQATAANAFGKLTTQFEDNLLVTVSCVGYRSKSVRVTSNTDVLIVQLIPVIVELDEVIVRAAKPSVEAEKILNAARNGLYKNSSSFSLVADFRHTIKENNHYVKLLEAELLYKDPKGYNGKLRPEIVQEQLLFLQRRESLNFGIDRVDFQRSYFDFYVNEFAFLLKNSLKYALSSRKYDYALERIEESRDKIVYEISAFDRTTNQSGYTEFFDMTYEIILQKNVKEYFIKSYELNYRNSTLRKYLAHSENGYFRIEMDEEGGYVKPKQISHFLVQETKYDVELRPNVIEAFHTLHFREGQVMTKTTEENNKYNSDYWGIRPLEDALVKDLSRSIVLEQQFALQHNRAERQAVQEKINKQLLDAFLEENKKKNIYLILWEKPESLLDFLQSPDLFDQTKTILVFIGRRASHRDWSFIITGSGIMYYPQFNLPTLIKAYIPERSNLPVYILQDKSGNPTVRDQPIDHSLLLNSNR